MAVFPSFSIPSHWIKWSSWLSALFLLGFFAFVVFSPSKLGGIGAPFQLQAMDGRVVKSETLKGKPFAIFFGFTQCPEVCPTSMLEISQDLKNLGDLTTHFPVYFVTVDPERDDAETLRLYLSNFDARIIGLIPQNEAELREIARHFRVVYRKIPTPSGYTMDHTASIFLMDTQGKFVNIIDYTEKPDIRRAKIKSLLERAVQ